jgi:uridine kinase
MKMKVCFIYSGLSRTLINSIKMLNANVKISFKYDIYICTDINEKDNSYLNKKLDLYELCNLDNVKSILIDDTPDIPQKYKTQKEINMFYQWYKINKAYSIINFDNTYDYVIRIRSDFFILETLNDILNNIDNTKIYIPYGNDIGINDQFAIGTPELIKIYSSLIYELEEYITPDTNTCSEIVLYKHLQKHNIQVERFKLDYKLILSLCNVIGITGNSGSGKSTISNIIDKIFTFDKKVILETDRYHKWERGHEQWNNNTHLNPQSNYLEKLQEDTFNLKIGNDIYAVDYDHSNGKFTPIEKIESKKNIIICGLHTLYDNKLRDIIDLKVFIDTDEKLQEYWKIKRDVISRGYDMEKVLKSIKSRKDDYIKYIYPQKKHSDIIIKYYAKCEDNDFDSLYLQISMRNNIFTIIKDKIKYIKIIDYENDYIDFEVLPKHIHITSDEIYNLLLENHIDFIPKNNICEGYSGIIQYIFILVLYVNNKDASYIS